MPAGKPAKYATLSPKSKMKRREKYQEYLESPEWNARRKWWLRRADWRCQFCNESSQPLHCHHRTYGRIYHEDPDDVIVLCQTCHDWHHKKPKEKNPTEKNPILSIKRLGDPGDVYNMLGVIIALYQTGKGRIIQTFDGKITLQFFNLDQEIILEPTMRHWLKQFRKLQDDKTQKIPPPTSA